MPALPQARDGEFGPGIKSLTLVLYFAANVTEPKILALFHYFQVRISAGQVSAFLIKNQQRFHDEKDALYHAGLQSTPWQQIDDTATRVDGQNHYCQIVCNALYTAYFTTASKDRLTVLEVLQNFRARTYQINFETFELLNTLRLPNRVIQQLTHLPQQQEFNEGDFLALLQQHLPALGPQQQTRLLEAAAITAYHAHMEFPVIDVLICDDAPQFKLLTANLALCWIHEGRHYKKLTPCLPYHQQLLNHFIARFWEFYRQLLAFKTNPTDAEKSRLANAFDVLFATITGYDALDERIAKTKAKKESLLMVLTYPEIPLHNNASELGARLRVRKRKISFGPRTADGKKAWDTFMTLTATTQKLEISFYAYVYDRIAARNAIPSLATIIAEKAKERKRNTAWDTS